MKKLRKITLSELENQAKVLDENEKKIFLGGGTPYPDGNVWYTSAEAQLLASFGVWSGGYVIGQGHWYGASGISADNGMGSAYNNWLTDIMNGPGTVSGITGPWMTEMANEGFSMNAVGLKDYLQSRTSGSGVSVTYFYDDLLEAWKLTHKL